MKLKIHTQIFIGIVLGVLFGGIFREQALIVKPIGDLFVRLLRMIIVPLVMASMIMGIVSLGSMKQLGKVGVKTFSLFLITTLLAVVMGLFVVNVFQPGQGAGMDLAVQAPAMVSEGQGMSLGMLLLRIVPDNILVAIVQADMLGVIFFSLILGCALIVVGRKAEKLVSFFDALNEVMLKITDWIMCLAPIGVFALIATLVARTGIAAFKPMALYMLVVILGLVLHAGITMVGILYFSTKYSPKVFIKHVFPALATGFSTDSSLATIPVTVDCLERGVGVSKKVSSFVVPLGATMNMDGTALYEAVAVLFIAQVYGIDLSLMQQVIVCITATLASIGTAGIPSAGLVTMVIVLRAVNVPIEGIGIILAVDRILDMCRTVVNIFGDTCVATVIATIEGEKLQKE